MPKYQISTLGDSQNAIVVLDSGVPIVVPGTHPQWENLIKALVEGTTDEEVQRLQNLDRAITEYLELSERLAFRDEKIYFDGDPIDNDLTKLLVEMVVQGDDVTYLVNFFEKLATNPSEKSREALWRWVSDRGLTITPEGDFVAYKVVRGDGTSVHAGKAMVDGVEVVGNIPNEVGSVITMPRSGVDDNTHVYCSTGLHAGTWDYVTKEMYGGERYLIVVINPRDVVSVPDDHTSQKLRCCRYVVSEITEGALTTSVYQRPVVKEADTYGVSQGSPYDDEPEWGDGEDDGGPIYCDDPSCAYKGCSCH